jgi:hypothetical protein
MQPRQVGAPLRLPTHPAWRPRPTLQATGAPVATCEQLHCHSHHYRASSTTEPVPRLEATQRMTQQCQPGATVNAVENGPVVMAVVGGREQRSRRQPSLRPIQGQRGNSLPRREDGAPVFRARATAFLRTTRPVALTPRRDRRRPWQEKQVTLHLRHNDCVKKRCATPSQSRIISFFLFLSLTTGTRKGGYPEKGSFSVKGTGPEPPY